MSDDASASPGGGFFRKLEDAYYSFMDFLDQKLHLPVYKYFVEPLESRGIPSFRVFSAIILVIVLLAAYLLFFNQGGGAAQGDLTVSVLDSSGKPLLGALVKVLLSGNEVDSEETGSSGSVFFKSLRQLDYDVKATKSGFKPGSETVDLKKENSLRIVLECASASCATPTVTPTPTVRPSPTQPATPTPEAAKGKLMVTVLGPDSEFVNASVSVYNAFTGLLISDFNTSGGVGVLGKELDIDTRVFLAVEAVGYVAFNGDSEPPIVIESGWNKKDVRLALVNASIDVNESTVYVLNATGQGIPGSNVDFYEFGSIIPVLKGRVADEFGRVAVDLNSTKDYQALASSLGYFSDASPVFKGGNNANVSLVKMAPETTASLDVSVVFVEDDEPASSAEVGVFLKTEGNLFKLQQATADADGKRAFNALPRGKTVRASAFKDARYGFADLLLVNEKNEATVKLSLGSAKANVTAFDVLTMAPLNARFEAFYKDALLSSCDGAQCLLNISADVPVLIKATAAGYAAETRETVARINETVNVSFKLVSNADLDDSQLVFQGVFTPAGAETSVLRPGGVYEARFNLVSARADYSGAFFKIRDSKTAAITGFTPPGSTQTGSSGSSCSPTALQSNVGQDLNSVELKYYSGGEDYSRLIKVNVTVDPAIPLDAATKTAKISLDYSSFIERGAKVIRNPFTSALGSDPATPYLAGCEANRDPVELTVSSAGTSGTEFSCVTLFFAQAGKQGGFEGFEASLASGFDEFGNFETDPLVVAYDVEVFKPLSGDSKLSFASNAQYFSANGATLPFSSNFASDSACTPFVAEGGVESVELNGAFGVLDLSRLASCSSYDPGKPFGFFGAITGDVLAKTDRADFSATFSSGGGETKHDSWFKVSGGGLTVSEYAAVEFLYLKQKQPDAETGECASVQLDGGEIKPQGDEAFAAVIGGGCEDEELEAGVQAVARQGTQNAVLKFNYDSALFEPVRVSFQKEGATEASIWPVKELGLDLRKGVAIGPLEKGKSVKAWVWFDLKAQGSDDEFNFTFNNGFDTSVVTTVLITPEVAVPQTKLLGPPDDCGGLVKIDYSVEHGLVLSCKKLALFVSPVFPADAVPVAQDFEGTLLSEFNSEDGSGECFALENKLLKYDPRLAGCPAKFKLRGGAIAGAKTTMTIGFGALKTTLEISVAPLSLEGLPVALQKIADVAPESNQLWRFVDNDQLSGSRTIGVEYGSYSINLVSSGPGAVAFDVIPPASGTLKFTENSGEAGFLATPEAANSKTPPEKIKQFIQTAQNLAKATAFRRSFAQKLWCQPCPQGKENCVDDASGKPWECRASEGAWQEFVAKTSEYYEACDPSCVDYYPGAPSDWNCDSRCEKDGGSGSALIANAEKIFNSEGTLVTCNDAQGCAVDCGSWCSEPNCVEGCVGGLKPVEQQYFEQNWVNVTALTQLPLSGGVSAAAFDYYPKGGLYPYSFFNSGSAKFEYYGVLNAPDGFVMPAGLNVKTTDDCLGLKGVFVFRGTFDGINAKYFLDPLVLSSGNRVGDAEKACVKFDEQKLCGRLYSDASKEYGSCTNAFYAVFDDDSVDGIKDVFKQGNCDSSQAKHPDLRTEKFIAAGQGTFAMQPGDFVVATPEGMIVSYDGRYDCESGASNTRRHFFFWNPLGEAVMVSPMAIDSPHLCSDAASWGYSPQNHPEGFKTCVSMVDGKFQIRNEET